MQDNDYFSLDEAVTTLRASWRAMLIACCVAAVLGLLVQRVRDPEYHAAMLVAPATTIEGADVGGSASGGLAAVLENSTLPLGQDNQTVYFEQFLQLVTSEVAAERLMRRNDKLVERAFSQYWDAETNTWRRAWGPMAILQLGLGWLAGYDPWHPPTTADFAKYLSESVTITAAERSGMFWIEFANADPVFARDLLAALHAEVDLYVKQLHTEQSREAARYARQQLEKVANGTYRDVLISVLVNHEKQLVLNEGSLSFAAVMVAQPRVPDWPRRWSPVVVAFVNGTVGAFGAFLYTLIRRRLRVAGAARAVPAHAAE